MCFTNFCIIIIIIIIIIYSGFCWRWFYTLFEYSIVIYSNQVDKDSGDDTGRFEILELF